MVGKRDAYPRQFPAPVAQLMYLYFLLDVIGSFDCQVVLGAIKAVKLLATVLWSQAPIFSFFAITM